ncbi:MAG: hypothetical protein U5N85_12110 [Arcicella sp.]|nr:hypothetical protein [Arcicella sp.]
MALTRGASGVGGFGLGTDFISSQDHKVSDKMLIIKFMAKLLHDFSIYTVKIMTIFT